MAEVIYAQGNSEAAWDLRFSHGEWDAVQGEELTTTFAYLILDHLPHEVLEAIPGGELADFGCARGQFVQILRDLYPNALTIDGLDHSHRGLNQAKARYGERDNSRFLWTDGALPDYYDIVFCSNVMEHLVDPVGMMMRHLERTNAYYVVLSPFDEDLGGADREAMTPGERDAAGHTHVQRFTDPDAFPADIEGNATRSGWRRILVRTDLEPGPIWPGRQMLLVWRRI